MFRAFYGALKSETEAGSTEQKLGGTSLDYPTATVFHREFYLPGYFNGVTMKRRSKDSDFGATPIESVAVFQFNFHNMKINKTNREFLYVWEDQVYDFAGTFSHPLINVSMQRYLISLLRT